MTATELALEQLLMWCLIGLLAAFVAVVVLLAVMLSETRPDPEPPDWVNDGKDPRP